MDCERLSAGFRRDRRFLQPVDMALATVVHPRCVAALEVVNKPSVGPLLNSELDTLPSGFPLRMDTALAWEGAHFAGKSDYIHTLDETDRAEIAAAVEHFKSQLCPT